MVFLFVHSWQGFCLAEWYLREALFSVFGNRVQFVSVDVPSHGIPANDILLRAVSVMQPDLVGFSCHYWSIGSFLESARDIKVLVPQAWIVLGGPNVSSPSYAEDLMQKHAAVDCIVQGRGEEALVELINARMNGHSLSSVSSITYREGTTIHGREPAKEQIRQRGMIFCEANTELKSNLPYFQEVSMETLSGCRSSCSYCVYHGNTYRVHDDDRVLSEMAFLLKNHVPIIRINDSYFGGTAKRAKKILLFAAQHNTHSVIKLYPDVSHIDEEYLGLLADAHAEINSIGIQTATPEALRLANRSDLLQQSATIRRILSRFPHIPADMIIGLPGDTSEGCRKTCRAILDLGFRSVNINVLRVFPGTALYSDCARYFQGPLALSYDGQFVASDSFPNSESQTLCRNLCALEIGCACVRTRACLLKRGGKESEVIDMLLRMDDRRLFNLRTLVAARHKLRDRTAYLPEEEMPSLSAADDEELETAFHKDIQETLCPYGYN
jgi:radical SAM superfamily enzyme YgiQ (UPF0313 family)